MSLMRDFSWRYFCATGEIDAYLLYKESEVVLEGNEDLNATREEIYTEKE
jgi:hypothetical protein